jgi:hypothetical protein
LWVTEWVTEWVTALCTAGLFTPPPPLLAADGTSLVTGLLFGLAPALRAGRGGSVEMLRQGGVRPERGEVRAARAARSSPRRWRVEALEG